MPSGDQRRGSLATGEWRRDGRSVRARRLGGSSQIGDGVKMEARRRLELVWRSGLRWGRERKGKERERGRSNL